MSESVFITGSGLVTPLGASGEQTWTALLAGEYIHTHSSAKLEPRKGTSRIFQIAQHAAREALTQAGWMKDDLSDDRTALVVGTSKGPVELWTAAPPSEKTRTSDNVGPAGRLNFGLATLADELAVNFHHGYGPRLTTSAACASSLHALIRATMLIRSGVVDRALVVAAESSLQPMFLACFQRLGVFPPPGETCKPFDENRAGFLMSEAAAAVCIERSALARAKPIVQIDRFAIGGDATHLTGTDPAARTLRHLLRQCMTGHTFDLIHAHGTGTPMNDATELAAFEAFIEEGETATAPAVYSHKGALGHSLGAAGLVAVVINLHAHEKGVIPPNIQTTHPLTTRLPLSRASILKPVQTSLITATGFGGATTVLTLRSE